MTIEEDWMTVISAIWTFCLRLLLCQVLAYFVFLITKEFIGLLLNAIINKLTS